MKVMMDGHRMFFQALGRFLGDGHSVVIIAGNHDIEWNVPEIQQAFRGKMKSFIPAAHWNPDDAIARGITFYSWFYYEPGLAGMD